MAPSEPLVVSRQQWSRCVYITAIATFILLWIFAWSWQSETIIPTSEREPQWPLSEEYTMEPMMALPANSEKLCTSDAYNVGKWVKKPIKLSSETPKGVEEAAGYHCAWNFPHKCYRRLDEKGEFNRSVRMLDYKWQPSDCDMLPFDARIFANYLANHPLLFVGDSINQLAFESMACLLGESLVDPSSDTNMTGGNTNFWAGQKVHKDKAQVEGAVTLGYLRTDYLVRLDDFKIMEPFDDEGYLIGKGSNFPWVHALHRFDHIVINTGPHWHTDKQWGPEESDEELMAAFKKAMRIVFDYLLENLKPTQRVWVRSSPYGHAKCSQYTKPDQIPHPPTRKPGEYQWDMHEKFDQVWRDMIESAKDSRIKFFNVSPMSNLRGDAHSRPDSDCLHTCLPGPVDDWNKLLFQEIALEAAPKA